MGGGLTEALEHVARVYNGACESIVRHLLSLLTDPQAGLALPRPSMLKAPQATQTQDAQDEPPYVAHVREAIGLLPVVWDACEPLQPLMRQWLDPPSTDGEGWAEREVVTIPVALEIVKQVSGHSLGTGKITLDTTVFTVLWRPIATQ